MKVLVIALSALLFMSVTTVAVSPVNTGWFGTRAIKGYDPVAYFTQGKPVKGRNDFQVTWSGATWYFSSATHKKLFQNTPEADTPQYGGYCAWAVSQNSTAGINPAAWSIVDGKLYLNYSKKIQHRWDQDLRGFIRLADQYWPALKD